MVQDTFSLVQHTFSLIHQTDLLFKLQDTTSPVGVRGIAKEYADSNWSPPFEVLDKCIPRNEYPNRLGPVWFDPKKPKKLFAGAQHLHPKDWLKAAEKFPGIDTISLDAWNDFAKDVIQQKTPKWLRPESRRGASQLQQLLEFWQGKDDNAPLRPATSTNPPSKKRPTADPDPPEPVCETTLPSVQVDHPLSEHGSQSTSVPGSIGQPEADGVPDSAGRPIYTAPFSGPRQKRSRKDMSEALAAVKGATQSVPYTSPKTGDYVIVGIDFDEEEGGFLSYNPNKMPELAVVINKGTRKDTVLVSKLF